VHNVYIEEGEDATPSHEFINFLPYECFTWDEGIVVANIYQTVSSFDSSLSLINREYCCS